METSIYVFIEKTRARFGESSDEFFLATTVMMSLKNTAVNDGSDSSNCSWAVPVATLGAGTFGTVTKMDVPTLGEGFAVKRLKEAGTTGGLPPEAMLCREVPCEASQDVYALGHLILLTFTKHEWKGHNMWLSKAVRGNEDFRCTGTKGEQRKYLDKVTLRNQIDPRTRAVLLNPDHLVDELGKEVKELVSEAAGL
eukprot:g19124.t1